MMVSKRMIMLALFAAVLFAPLPRSGAEEPEILYWTCGMHPSVRSDEPGKCPICNMDLVPVTKEEKKEPEILYWTCGMHPSVRSDEPGKCPICNMDLVPVTKEEKKEPEILYWTCGMHPSVRSDEPGKCPICNMNLVPVTKEEEPSGKAGEAVELVIGAEAARLARISTAIVTRMMLSLEIDAPGEIAYDETRTAVISPRIGGWIETLHADETGMELRAGDPLVEIYSPELVSAQKEYLLARWTELEAHAREKLLLFGLTDAQIRTLRDESDVSTTLTLLSPVAGTVLHRNVTEGERIQPGRDILHIADLSRLWVLADIFENDISFVRVGQDARISIDALPGEEFASRVSFVEPVTNRSTRSTRIRLEIDNPAAKLKPGMFARVRIVAPLGGIEKTGGGHGEHAGERGVLAVPRGAVVNTGRRTVAFVETAPGRYVMRNVELGPIAGDHYVVLGGLSENERVVERGSFLLDSQARLTGQAEEIYGGALGKESEKSESEPKHVH